MTRDRTQNKQGVCAKTRKASLREDRLKEALRENLRRRKGQTHARKNDGQTEKN